MVSAVAAPVLLVAGLTAAGQLQPPQFDALYNTVSALAGQGANDGWVMTFTFVVVGACDIVTAFALHPAARPGRILLAAAGFAGMMVAAFPERLGGSLIHACWASLGFGGLILWPALAWHQVRPGRLVPWGLRPLPCLSASLILAALTSWFAAEDATHAAQMGIAERAAGITQTIWPLVVVVSCRLFYTGREPSGAGSSLIEPDLEGE
jgi:hypothetical membrane protein